MTKPLHLYIDFSYMCYRQLYAVKGTIMEAQKVNEQYKDDSTFVPVDPFGVLRHVVLTDIFENISKFGPDHVLIACDHKKSWRKKFFEAYKAQRKELKEKDEFDFDLFYAFMDDFIQEIKSFLPFMTLHIPYLEGDDIIGQLVKINHHDNSIIFITADQDYYQLMQYDDVRMFNPMTKKMIEKTRAEALNDLEVKILMGDKSDNIPACRPKLGQKTAEKLILGEVTSKKENKTLEDLMQEEEFKKNYERNTRLINMNNCPKALVDKLKEEVDNYQYVGVDNVFNYFMSKKLKELMSKASLIGKDLKKIVTHHNQETIETLFA